METGDRLGLVDVFVSIRDPRQAAKVEHELVVLLIAAVGAVLVGTGACFRAHPVAYTPHSFAEVVEKDHGRLETRRCYAFAQLECLDNPRQWPGLRSFAVIESERATGGKTTREQRLYISSLAADARAIARAVRSHWSIENRLHWCMDVAFHDDQMRVRTKAAAHNLAVLKHITLNLIRLDPIQRKGGIKARRFIAATSDPYRARLLGLG